jgi:glycosyltransferase involved in cell wall biosynthesis
VRHRVLLFCDTLNIGGTEGQFVELARRLDRNKWDVSVGCVRAVGPLADRLHHAGVSVASYGPSSFKSVRVAGAVVRLARAMRASRADIVHAFELYSNVLAVPAARIARVPVIVASQREMGDLRSTAERQANRIALRLATHVVVNSEAVAEVAPIRGRRRHRLIVLRNGIDTTRFSPGESSRTESNDVRVGTLGNLRSGKGLDGLLHAMALVHEARPEVRFAIWGDGPLRPTLEWQIDRLGLSNVVELRGNTRRPEDALRELNVFVHASVSEGCSNALLEAMATGLAIVATRIKGSTAVVSEEETAVLVTPGDSQELAKAIIRLVEDPARAAALGARARERVCADFDIRQSVRATETFYERALAEMGAGG